MRTTAPGDVLKVITYVIVTFLLGALITPPLYEMGKGFAHVALSEETTGMITWLATKAEAAEFETYFKRALFLSAIVGLFPLFHSLRPGARPRRSDRSHSLPDPGPESSFGQPLAKVRFGFLQTLSGFFLTSGLLLLMSWFIFRLQWFEWKREPPGELMIGLAGKVLLSSLFVSILEEAFFRGALLGIFLRAFKPSVAIFSLSVVFATTHFLTPPGNAGVADPRAADAGFEMLGLIGRKFLQPELLVHSFLSLLLVGLLLGFARYRTASLWLPVGLHAGWVFSLKMFGRLTERRADFPAELHLLMGKRMTEGLIPIAMLGLTGLVLALSLKTFRPKEEASQ